MLKIALRAGIVIDTGNAFFNILGLLGGKNVIKITTMHGSGPKATNGMYDSIDRNLAETFRLDRFDYINFPSSYSASMVGRSHFKLPRDKVVSLGYPRLDNYFDESFLIRTKSERKYCKKVFSDINESSKIILYTPTWRPYEYRFPILEMKDFDLGRFEEYLEKNDLYFCYSCHTANIPQNIPKNGKRIHFLEHKDDPFFDINIFMAEVDILLNDYSTTSTEFSILKRPQVFLMPDYDYYFEHKGFIEEYRDIMPGVEVRTLSDLESTLDSIINNRTEYLEKYELMRKKLLERYYDTSITNSSKHFSDFIESLQ
jgi:CDP-glycerol glycerophosphotransferase (TagB/SpsB family)